ncbi:hypothetical protein BC939DRAFT_452948 [Gamsiella multidivaricata]|uniref:uncharacterized protein n=1 Tax=Gamsiella multidivaricata TaxID=101098 RepID=UPI00221E851D|nr:uncharacterized protein BC939DRAFT_452948 [Gamsiella multidivaricata]KAI7822902.1 hypothetical protein BC939DRAFT_452948 [Gamsiella multidivaricata]
MAGSFFFSFFFLSLFMLFHFLSLSFLIFFFLSSLSSFAFLLLLISPFGPPNPHDPNGSCPVTR